MTDSMNASARYSGAARFFHWLIVALIIGQWWLSEQAALADSDAEALMLFGLHKSFGMTVLALAIARLAFRVLQGAPPRPVVSAWQSRAAHFVHALFYALLFLLPLSGWLGSSASAYSVSWFNLFVFTDLVQPDEGLKSLFFSIHYWAWRLLLLLVVLHVLAALKHHFLEKNNVLRSMLTPGAPLIVGVGLVIVLGTQSYSLRSSGAGDQRSVEALPETIQQIDSDAALIANYAGQQLAWEVDYAESTLSFEAQQSGATFTGVFEQWATQIYFQPAQRQGLILTTVNLLSVNTQDGERDDTLQQPDFFDTAAFPEARFVAYSFEPQSSGDFAWRSQSHLTIKGVAQPVVFEFSVQQNTQIMTLEGEALLDRLALSVGIGEWADTKWIGQQVKVLVKVVARAPQQ